MTRITGHLGPKEIKEIRVYWVKKFDAKCPYCGASIKKFGNQIKDDLFHCRKCRKYHTL